MPIKSPIQLFNCQSIREVPDSPGVYALLYTDDVIFFGRSHVSVRAALLGHRHGEEDSTTRIATHFRFELCEEPQLREEELLREYRESHGAYPWCNETTQTRA